MGVARGHVIDRRSRDHRGGLLVGADEIVRADVGRLHPQRACREVDDPLARPRLRLPRAAERDVGAGVRRHHGALERVVGDSVRVREEHPHQVQDDRGWEHGDGVRALVHRHAHPRAEDRRVLGHREIDGDDVVARVPRREQVLDAVFDPLHRSRELTRRDTHRDLLAARVGLLAERAADVTTSHRDEVFGMVQEHGHRPAERVRILVRDVDHQLTGVAAEVGEDGAAFHGHVGHALLRERLRHDDVRLRERGVDVAVGIGTLVHDVRAELLEQHRTRRVERIVDRDDRRQGIDVDVDELARVLGEGAALGHHDGEWLTGAPHLVVGEHGVGSARGIPTGPVGCSIATSPSSSRALATKSTPGAVARRAHVDRPDAAVRDVAPHERGMEDAGNPDVVDVVALPGHKTRVLDPRGARADQLSHEGESPPRCAWRTSDGSRPSPPCRRPRRRTSRGWGRSGTARRR